jgi:hypothetical protein
MIFIEWTYSRATIIQAVTNSKHKLGLTDLFLGETFFIAYVVSEVSSSKIVHGQIQVCIVLKSAFHVDQERMAQIRQYSPLV